uniref:S-adenosylmethionine-dependent methyltransferase n=1 Tax=Colletotrichum fructicola (strain Nara gc5) TaxID=1213859 RepID=L2G5B2_COLFN
MAAQKEDKWTTEAYQRSASFVPKLATKVVGWLDVQKDDVILDIGCGGEPPISSRPTKSHTLTNFLDATKIATSSTPALQTPTFTKAFSNAALHWILRPPGAQIPVFTAMRTALLMAVSRRVGVDKAKEVDPWFFPDEAWLTNALEKEGGVEVWCRLMGKELLDAVEDEGEREKCVREVADVLEHVCAVPGGGHMISYVRLRCVARKI